MPASPHTVRSQVNAPDGGRLPSADKLTIGALLVSTFVMILNETLMNVALQPLMEEFQVSEPTIQWLTTAFMLTLATVIPITGFLMQRYSLRAVFTAAMGLFIAGTALAAAAPGFEVLLAGRVVQASGTAIMLPLMMTTVLTLVPLHRRGVVMGNISIVISVAPATGPALSGLILHLADWRWLFLMILPIAVIALFLGRPRLNKDPGTAGKRLSIPSLLLAVPGFGGVVYGISQIGGGHGTQEVSADAAPGVDPVAIAVLVAGVLCLIGFGLLQVKLQKTDSALLNLKPFAYTMYTRALAMMLLMMIALFGALILLPLFLQTIRGLDTLQTGLILLPGGLLMALMAPYVGRLYDRVGPKPLVIPGASILIVALFCMSLLSPTTPVGMVLGLHLLLSSGLALLFTPAFTTALNPLPKALYSHGTAALNTLQQLAAAIGTAALVAAVGLGTAAAVNSGMNPDDAAVEGFRVAFRLAAGLSVGTLILATTLRATPAAETESTEAAESEIADPGVADSEIADPEVADSVVADPELTGAAADTDIEDRAQAGPSPRG
ncbi:DHA2 family efflux MFS transporter permease subunit [Nesterenkonia jeotgali]|uniref:DHA2 family lincomycin resistance protein-like MFS transporter n=1 Tax=Nesterenkonia jeotgali TaxID=317018 RepID=A0A839FSA6_9MICC|nr:DHA2 family efflux MFS transporter permease subunit [Nesterenkonia jeotgali]MBA8922449.1 DHA2 family lincomycin resistance protein-like MFS transporter [Nesterenkonia jeotgali]